MAFNQSCVSEACLPAKIWGICYNDNYSSINSHWYYALYLVCAIRAVGAVARLPDKRKSRVDWAGQKRRE